MKKAFLSRLGGAIIAVVLGTSTLAAVGAAPASANNATCDTTTAISASTTSLKYGDYASFRGEATVTSCAGGTPTTLIGTGAGSTVIEQSADGVNWTPVATGPEDYVLWYGDNIVPASAWFRARYTGGKETGSSPDSFRGSVSAPVRVTVNRTYTGRTSKAGGKARFKVSVAPAFTGKVKMQLKKGKRWKQVRKVMFRNGRAVFKVGYPRHGKSNYRLVIPAQGGYPAVNIYFWTKRY